MEGWLGKTPFYPKKHMVTRLSFAELHLNGPQKFWTNILWTYETKVEIFAHHVERHVL